MGRNNAKLGSIIPYFALFLSRVFASVGINLALFPLFQILHVIVLGMSIINSDMSTVLLSSPLNIYLT